MSLNIKVEVSPGELLDKITILEIKASRIGDAVKLANVKHELSVLSDCRDQHLAPSPKLTELTVQLRTINEALWQIEDDIRDCERKSDFGTTFVELARAVYHQNDQRAAIKKTMNELLGSAIIEEKSYAKY